MVFQLNPCKSLKKNKIRSLPNNPSFGVNFAATDAGKVKKSAQVRDLGENKK